MRKIKLLDEIENEIPDRLSCEPEENYDEDDGDDDWEDEEVEEICPIKKNKKRGSNVKDW